MERLRCAWLAPLLAAGCATALPTDDGADPVGLDTPDAAPAAPDEADAAPGPSAADAAPAPTDAAPVRPDAAPPGTGYGTHLLSEVAVTPTAAEFIEIYNPTASPISLSDDYLADVAEYYMLAAGAPTVSASDFITRFPAGAELAPGTTAVIAIASAAEFRSAYGFDPDYCLGPASGSARAMRPIAVGAQATLTNGGESIILFRWDGASDLGQDIDLLEVGQPSGSNALSDKSGVAVDGPDTDAIASPYAEEAFAITSQAGTPGDGSSTHRIALEQGHEQQPGNGNGVTGDDETSEETPVTWDAPPFGPPTPGAVPELAR
jgi:hypothetical protein